MNAKQTNQTELLSLYDFLGKAAGSELGKQVYAWVKARGYGPMVKHRSVRTRSYVGNILVYPRQILTQYFTGSNTITTINL
jgi:hypothetical protein